MLRIQQVSTGSAAFLSPTKASLQCRRKCSLLQAAIVWVASGLKGETVLDSMAGKKKVSSKKFFPFAINRPLLWKNWILFHHLDMEAEKRKYFIKLYCSYKDIK